jgi:transmembrane sensor
MKRGGLDQGRSEVKAQAAAWLARLQSEDRTTADEAGFRAWLAQSPGHQEAFDSLTTAWEVAGGLAAEYADLLDIRPIPAHALRPSRALASLTVAGGAAVLVASAAAWLLLDSGSAYATSLGEIRRVAVADGSTLVLDSDTALRVKLTRGRRDLTLLRGRAHFEVAKDPRRPFVVTAGARRVFAVGTVFDVAEAPAQTTVVLLEGKVSVQSGGFLRGPVTSRIMAPGERLTFDRAGSPREDRPDLAKLTAWQTGQALFNDDTMAQAAAELNRYSRMPLVIADPAVARMHVSGVFRAGATQAFAASVAALLPIRVRSEPDRIVITGRAPAG